MHWSAGYVGVPYVKGGRTIEGLDCWGLVRLAFDCELGILLPGYDQVYACADEAAEIAVLVGRDAGAEVWAAVEDGRAFDVAVFRSGRLGHHIGLVIAPGLMLHTSEGGCSGIEDFRRPRWSARRMGIFRHRELSA